MFVDLRLAQLVENHAHRFDAFPPSSTESSEDPSRQATRKTANCGRFLILHYFNACMSVLSVLRSLWRRLLAYRVLHR